MDTEIPDQEGGFLGLQDLLETALSEALSRTGSQQPPELQEFEEEDDESEDTSTDSDEEEEQRMSGPAGATGQAAPVVPPQGQAPGTEENPVQVSGFTDAQFRTLLQTIQPAARDKTKAEKPPTYSGDAEGLRTFLAQCQLYFDATTETSNRKRIAYVKSLLRGPAAKWITPFTEGQTETWTNYAGFRDARKY